MSEATLDAGPYMNEDGDWWVPVEAIPNRMKAATFVKGHMDPGMVLQYEGQVTTLLTPHEYGCDCNNDCLREVRAWHFTEREA